MSRERGEELEPTLDVEVSPMMEPHADLICDIPTVGTSTEYWQAQKFASTLHMEFEELQRVNDIAGMRQRFYTLARYYGKTVNILRSALRKRNEGLVNAALHNIIALHEPMHHMHTLAPEAVPLVITLEEETRGKLTEDLIVKTLQGKTAPMNLKEIRAGIIDDHFMVRVSEKRLLSYTEVLKEQGYIEARDGGYIRTNRRYSALNINTASLRALLGDNIYQKFEKGGYPDLSSMLKRRGAFLDFFQRFSGCSSEMGDLFIGVAIELTGYEEEGQVSPQWDYVDLINSTIPRPYQRLIYSIFRGYGYHRAQDQIL